MQRFSKQIQGTVILETVLVLALLFTFFSGMTYFGIVIQQNGSLAESVRVGGRAAELSRSDIPSDYCNLALDSAESYLNANGISHYSVSASLRYVTLNVNDDSGGSFGYEFYALHLNAGVNPNQRLRVAFTRLVSSTFEGVFRIALKDPSCMDIDCGVRVR